MTKMKEFAILVCLSILMFNFTEAQSLPELDKVKQIKILKSDRDEIRKIFANYELEKRKFDWYYEDNWGYLDMFYSPNAEIKVSYSEGKCKEANSRAFNVPEWKVEYVKISLNQPIKLKDFFPYLSTYKKEKIYKDVPDLYAYYNMDLGIIYRVYKNEIQEINLIPPSKSYSLMCDKKREKILTLNQSIFDQPLKFRTRPGMSAEVPINVIGLELSRSEIILTCNTINSTENKNCADNVKVITVISLTKDFYNYTGLDRAKSYYYKVSGGKIIGSGKIVQWDLSDVKPGTYVIESAVDDGCGFCGRMVSKTVMVRL